MLLPETLLEATNLVKEGSMEISVGRNSVRVERDFILIDLHDPESLKGLLDREDILPQVKHLSEEFSRTGKTLEIKYKNATVFKIGAGARSVVLQLLGYDHVAVGNPVTVYRFLQVWQKS